MADADFVGAAVAALLDSGNHHAVDQVTLAPRGAGIYSWWSHHAELLGIPGTRHGASYLYYVGIASDRSGLRRRLTTHATRRVRSSTLRLTLAALGAVDCSPRLDGRGRVTLDRSSETELSAWIAQNLWPAWLELDDPHQVERDVIQTLAPPLNLDGNASHPSYAAVKAARSAFKARAIP